MVDAERSHQRNTNLFQADQFGAGAAYGCGRQLSVKGVWDEEKTCILYIQQER
jgi:hypothetical protein